MTYRIFLLRKHMHFTLSQHSSPSTTTFPFPKETSRPSMIIFRQLSKTKVYKSSAPFIPIVLFQVFEQKLINICIVCKKFACERSFAIVYFDSEYFIIGSLRFDYTHLFYVCDETYSSFFFFYFGNWHYSRVVERYSKQGGSFYF